MNKITQFLATALLILPATYALSGGEPLKLDYQVSREETLPYLPILLKINIQNQTEHPITIYTQPEFRSDRGLSVIVHGSKVNENCKFSIAVSRQCENCRKPFTISPHGSYPMIRELAMADGLTNPGRYDLEIFFKATYDEAGATPFELHADSLHLDIEQPGETDRELIEDMSKSKIGSKGICSTFHGLVPLTLLVKHPESGYVSRQLRLRGGNLYSDDNLTVERLINISSSRQPERLRHDLGLDISGGEDETHTLAGIRLHTKLLDTYLKTHPHDESAALFWGNEGVNKLIMNDLTGACESFSQMRKLAGDQVPKASFIMDTSEYQISEELPVKVMKALDKRNLCPVNK